MPHRQHKIALLAYEGLCSFEFATAAELLRDRLETRDRPWYDLVICSLDPSPVRGSGGIAIQAEAGLEAFEDAETIVIPGWRLTEVPAELTAALRQAHARGARLLSICTGAFALAAAGVIDGRRATTHWRYAQRLAREYPNITVEPDVLYVDEGDVVTSAGSAAGLDMLLHVIRKDWGAATCNMVARTMLVPPHRDGGQAQFIERPVPPRPDARLAKVFDRLRSEPAREHRIEDLAALAAMSPRTLFRQFRAATGGTPYDWLLRERVAAAKRLLEETGLSIEQVADRAGFGAADTLRHHFRSIAGTAPTEYRRAFAPQRQAPIDAAE